MGTTMTTIRCEDAFTIEANGFEVKVKYEWLDATSGAVITTTGMDTENG